MSTTAEKFEAASAAGIANGVGLGSKTGLEAPAGTDLDEVAAALEAAGAESDEERAERLAAEQAELDSEDRQTPDYPDGAADDPVSDPPAHEEPAAESEPEETLAERLRRESGLAGDEDEARGETPDGQLPGMPEPKLTSHAGGAKPTSSEFKLNGRSLDLGPATQFAKGSKTRIVLDVEWGTVAFVDKHDKETGQTTETIRRHTGKIVSYELEDVA